MARVKLILLILNFVVAFDSESQHCFDIQSIDTLELTKFSNFIEREGKPFIRVYEAGAVSSEVYDLKRYLLLGVLKNNTHPIIIDREFYPYELANLLMSSDKDDAIRDLIKSRDLNYEYTNQVNNAFAGYCYLFLKQFCESNLIAGNEISAFEVKDGRFIRNFVLKYYNDVALSTWLDSLFLYDSTDFKPEWERIRGILEMRKFDNEAYQFVLFNELLAFYSTIESMDSIHFGSKDLKDLNRRFLDKQTLHVDPSLEFLLLDKHTIYDSSFLNIAITIDGGKIRNVTGNGTVVFSFPTKNLSCARGSEIAVYNSDERPASFYMYVHHRGKRWKRRIIQSQCFDIVACLPEIGRREKIFYTWQLFR